MTATIRPLTPRQQKAADHFLIHGSKTEAYRHAYSCNRSKAATVCRNAFALFEQPNVVAYVQDARQEATDKAVLTLNEALQILSDIARGKVSDLLDESGDIDPAKVVQSGFSLEAYEVIESGDTIRRRIKVRDPVQAIERIARLLGWDHPEKLDVAGVVFNINLAGALPLAGIFAIPTPPNLLSVPEETKVTHV